MEDKILTLQDFISNSSKTVPTSLTMDLYMEKLKNSIDNAVVAMENGQDSTAAMYIGESKSAMEHISAVWNVILNRK